MTSSIFYGGKGGVGKTTCAAATGLRLAAEGRETLVVSTDPAHSLADALEIPLGPEPRSLESVPRLSAVEIDPETRADRYERIARALASDLRSAGVRLSDEEVERLFASGAPAGADELAALDLLVEYVDGGSWDAIVFDTAPTGHTLRLFDLPAVMDLALETTQSLRGQVRRIGDSAKRMMLGPMAFATGGDDGPDGLVDLRGRMHRAREILRDPDRTEFRVVTIPETMAIEESKRLVDRLREAEIPVRTIVVNRVLEPEAVHDDCSRCRSRASRHEERLEEIERAFPNLAVVALPEAEGEVHGLRTLEPLADRLSRAPSPVPAE
ncbi:ArsA family ATPase [Natrialbaceae archaeon GCM10025810]|uniref:ArsA family ATPase n=1 Tax=Halovalidus salilacus TaxID=3075124 RepID=UPI003607606C